MIHLLLILPVVWSIYYSWFFLHVDIQLFHHHLLKRLSLHLVPFASLSKLAVHICLGLFLDFILSYSSFCFLSCFDANATVSLTTIASYTVSWNQEVIVFSLLTFQMYFGCSRFFTFPHEFYNQLDSFYKSMCWNFDGDCIESID